MCYPYSNPDDWSDEEVEFTKNNFWSLVIPHFIWIGSTIILISILFSTTGCVNNDPVYGEITNVYREFKLGATDGTTIVKLQDGRIIKYHGRLGKIGEKINVKGLTPVAW